jgi:hypothetical protein
VQIPESDRHLIRFLLGEVSEDDRRAVEREFLKLDTTAFTELVALEDELRFAYAGGGLTAAERESFERRYLAEVSDRLRQMFATAFMRAVDSAHVPGHPLRDAH